ncbi:elongation factor P [Candidatus Woesebacteria bacterium RBG_16_34_12]|uniref:Elongation factor P n=1 Tax=Candidatus Woesebacteria bacterium RBG_16_34_12 TaxID=1802480 RepID=A0A1F7X900_9BACT|nr:MAG: elongation factor P [Candidatus Woesebacteria bacterium RBG_16_34_12]
MIEATQLKNGKTFLMDGKPYKVIKYSLQKMGRGSADVKLSLRNLINGNLEIKVLGSSAKIEEIEIIKKPLQFLFKDSAEVTFMDAQTYEQVQIPFALIKDEINYIKEGEIVNILFWEDKPLSVEISPKVVFKVIETTPGVKGNSATNVYKPAILENGLQLKVPLFIKVGDRIKVDTRTGEYEERAK